MVCWGCQKELPKLDPEADLSAIQLVSPHTSKEELQSLYLKVYKQWRLPGLPPGEPELMEEVVSSFDDCQGQKQRRAPETVAQYWLMDIQPPRNHTPERERRESLVERSLANVRKAHQKALAMAVALEEEIEWLSCPPPGANQGWAHIPGVETAGYMNPGDRKGGTVRCSLKAAQPPILNKTLPGGIQSLAERWWLPKTLIWRSHWNWGQRSPLSLEGWQRAQRKREKAPLLNHQWKSSANGWCWKLKGVRHLTGGESC